MKKRILIAIVIILIAIIEILVISYFTLKSNNNSNDNSKISNKQNKQADKKEKISDEEQLSIYLCEQKGDKIQLSYNESKIYINFEEKYQISININREIKFIERNTAMVFDKKEDFESYFNYLINLNNKIEYSKDDSKLTIYSKSNKGINDQTILNDDYLELLRELGYSCDFIN